jgi:hypothetical protein
MKSRRRALSSVLALSALAGLGSSALGAPSQLTGQGPRTQLMVDGKPVLMLGGELANSSASSHSHSPFSIDTLPVERLGNLASAYSVLNELTPALGRHGSLSSAAGHNSRSGA